MPSGTRASARRREVLPRAWSARPRPTGTTERPGRQPDRDDRKTGTTTRPGRPNDRDDDPTGTTERPGRRPDLLGTVEKQELARLRGQTAELRRANDILKAVPAPVAKEPDQP
ncbi:hypothetical protein GCM10010129_72910 [Streptomyces fumigatiscleroticus]|nr:hypothetical protein GCM10010129_72910 [Streptomyces fumigatiscleroticus]